MDSQLVRQRGAATLTIALALIMAISMLSYAVAFTANTEQRMTHNEQLRLDSLQAAEAGLLFGREWLSNQRPNWVQVNNQLIDSPNVTPSLTTSTGDSFGINIVFEAEDENDRFLRVTSEASAAASPDIGTSLSQYVKPITILTERGERAPPLTIDGCLSNSLGQPRLLPDPELTNPVSLIISKSTSCLNAQLVNLGAGNAVAQAFPDNELWETYFAITPEEFENLVKDEINAGLPDIQRNYWQATASDLVAGRWVKSLGSPGKHIILVIPKDLGCPEFGGGAIIHGLVFVEDSCAGSGITSWGDVEIYGALAIGGDSEQLSSGVRITHVRYSSANPPRIQPPLIGAIPVPGTWSDL